MNLQQLSEAHGIACPKTTGEFWHWPDHVISKRESRRLREEHNARMNERAELLEALESCSKRMAELQEHTNYPLAWPRVQAADAIEKARKATP